VRQATDLESFISMLARAGVPFVNEAVDPAPEVNHDAEYDVHIIVKKKLVFIFDNDGRLKSASDP
jgi:hypothetical protein